MCILQGLGATFRKVGLGFIIASRVRDESRVSQLNLLGDPKQKYAN